VAAPTVAAAAVGVAWHSNRTLRSHKSCSPYKRTARVLLKASHSKEPAYAAAPGHTAPASTEAKAYAAAAGSAAGGSGMTKETSTPAIGSRPR